MDGDLWDWPYDQGSTDLYSSLSSIYLNKQVSS